MEHTFYDAVGSWLSDAYQGTHYSKNVTSLSLTSADVLCWNGQTLMAACEVKALAYPNGSAGYGAIGQALMLRAFVPSAYVALVAGESLGSSDCTWVNPKSKQRDLAEQLQLDWPIEPSFDAYCKYVGLLFSKLFGNTGVGLLVINADDGNRVLQLVPPVPNESTFRAPDAWRAAPVVKHSVTPS